MAEQLSHRNGVDELSSDPAQDYLHFTFVA